MDNEIEIKTSNEIEETKGIYTVPNILLFEYYGGICNIRAVYQEKYGGGFKTLTGHKDGREYCITSVNVFQVSPDTLYMKGDDDYTARISRTETVSVETGMFWESVLNRLKDFAVIHSMEELEKCRVIEDGGDKEDIDFSFKKEPSEEEINKMISLVDLSTFCKVIQNRLFKEKDGGWNVYKIKRPTSEDIGKIINDWAKEYLVDWAKAKYRFYKIFGDKLSIEKNVEHIPTRNDAICLKETLKSNFPLYAPILDYISDNIIKDNKMSAGTYPGFFNMMKDVNKMTFTKFMSLYQNEDLNNEISKLYQANGKTNLTISINPIDYLTVSINKSGWKSCHNFFEGGWGTAGLSLMFDKTSLVGFSSKGMVDYNEYYKKFTWNNKMWREMIYVSEENSAMVFSRQYPFGSDEFSKELRGLMEEQYSSYFNSNNEWFIGRSSDKYIDILSGSDLIYNDVKNGYDYKAIINKQDINKNRIKCTIGIKLRHISDKDVSVRGGDYTIW